MLHEGYASMVAQVLIAAKWDQLNSAEAVQPLLALPLLARIAAIPWRWWMCAHQHQSGCQPRQPPP